MAMQKKLSGVDRAFAIALGLAWLSAGTAGIVLGIGQRQVVVDAVSVAAIAYGLLWVRVAMRSRLLSWREAVFPWRW